MPEPIHGGLSSGQKQQVSSSTGIGREWGVMNIDYLVDKLSGEDGHLKDEPKLIKREMKVVDNSTDVKPNNMIRILSWNMLGDAMVQPENCKFAKTPAEALRWEIRRFRVLEEILVNKPDIVCLQECDHYDDFIAPGLGSVSYQGSFVAKPKGLNMLSRAIPTADGCCISYREDRFQAIKTETLYLQQDDNESNQVAIFTIFRLRSPNHTINSSPEKAADNVARGQEFCVVNTHLKSGAQFEELRVHQAKHMLNEIKSKVGNNVPLIICGDLNSLPDNNTYKVFTGSELKLTSAYSKLDEGKGDAPYTTWKIMMNASNSNEDAATAPAETMKHTVDYIWYSMDRVGVKALLPPPTEEQLGESKAPSKTYPSDHFSLAADLYFK